MSQSRPTARTAGFTLLELLIALSIVGALLAIAFGGLSMAIAAWTRGEDRAEIQQHTRGITQIIGRTVGAAYPYRGSFGEGPEKRILFVGAENRLEFVTQTAAFPTAVPIAFTAVVIAIEDSAQGRALVVRQRALPNRQPFTEAAVVLRDPTIHGLELQYLGTEGSWTDSWHADDEKKLPSAVRIRFGVSRNGKLEPLTPITVSLRALEVL
jgi:general secretion pathway protein J